MPAPLLLPLVITAFAGLFTGAKLAGDENDANVIVNTQTPSQGINLKTALLMGGVAVAAVVIAPKVLGK